MKTKYKIYFLITLLVLFFSCSDNPITKTEDNKSPIASFNIYPDSGDVNTIFKFNASRSGYNKAGSSIIFRWDWESDDQWDTNFLTTDTISHQFALPGKYLVKLEIMDSDSLSSTATGIVIVNKDSVIISFLTQLSDVGRIVSSEHNYLFLTKNNQLIINDINSSYIPNQLSILDFQSTISAAKIYENNLLVGTISKGLRVFNISDILHPVLVDSLTNLPVRSIKIKDNMIGVCSSSSVQFYDFQLNFIGGCSISGSSIRDFVTNNNYAYTSELWQRVGNYLSIYDMSNIENWGSRISSIGYDYAVKLEICKNNLLALNDATARIELFNINNPTNLELEDYASVGWTNNMVLKNDTLFAIGNSGGGISIFGVSDSSKFVFIANKQMESTRYLAVHSNFIYVSPYNSDDLYIFKYGNYSK